MLFVVVILQQLLDLSLEQVLLLMHLVLEVSHLLPEVVLEVRDQHFLIAHEGVGSWPSLVGEWREGALVVHLVERVEQSRWLLELVVLRLRSRKDHVLLDRRRFHLGSREEWVVGSQRGLPDRAWTEQIVVVLGDGQLQLRTWAEDVVSSVLSRQVELAAL